MKERDANRKEFSLLIEKHQAIIHKVAMIYAQGPADREDLFQEICLQLWHAYPNFRGDAKFSTWMFRVALNTAISKVRQNKNRPEYESLQEYDGLAIENPDEARQLKLLYKAISQLNRIDKAMILLWLEEKSYSEIAEMLGTSKANVSVKLVRIKRKLEEMVQDAEEREPF